MGDYVYQQCSGFRFQVSANQFVPLYRSRSCNGSDLARPSIRPRPRTRSRRRCPSFDFEDDDEDDWCTFDFAT